MVKKFIGVAMLYSVMSNAQVGINNNQPNTTLDISAKKGTTDKDGILIPRITKSELNAKAANTYSATENSAIVYVTDTATGTITTSSTQTTKITQPGFYYFQDTEWIPLGNGASSPALNPWLVQGGTTVATQNSENIYQKGNVAIGVTNTDNNTDRSEKLFVNGNTKIESKSTDGRSTILKFDNQSNEIENLFFTPNNNYPRSKSKLITNISSGGNPKSEILAGDGISNVAGKYTVSTIADEFSKGLGIHTFTSFKGESGSELQNSAILMDEQGLKVGQYRAYQGNGTVELQISHRDVEVTTLDGRSFVIDSYIFPKNLPTTGQVLSYDSETTSTVTTPKTVKTKWANLSDLIATTNSLTSSSNSMTSNVSGTTSSANIINSHTITPVASTNNLTSSINGVTSTFTVPNIYTSNGTISQQRVVNLTDSNTLTFTRTGTIPATDVPVISTNGSVQTIALRLDSDARLKENIQPINGNIVSSLNPVSYNWNEKGKAKGGNNNIQHGFIAQEIEKILPSAVYTDKDGYKSVNYIEVIPFLTQKVKDQDKTIEALLKRVEALEKNSK